MLLCVRQAAADVIRNAADGFNPNSGVCTVAQQLACVACGKGVNPVSHPNVAVTLRLVGRLVGVLAAVRRGVAALHPTLPCTI